MNPVKMNIINPQKEYWLNQGIKPANSFSQVLYSTHWAKGLGTKNIILMTMFMVKLRKFNNTGSMIWPFTVTSLMTLGQLVVYILREKSLASLLRLWFSSINRSGFTLSIAIVAKCDKKQNCGARFFHLVKVSGDNFLSSILNSTYWFSSEIHVSPTICELTHYQLTKF